MCTTNSSCPSARPLPLLAMLCLIATAGCATVETAKPTIDRTDRSAAGGAMEAGDPAAPADKAVVSAADDRASDVAASDSAANQSRDKSAAAKATPDKKGLNGSVSETREQRLREVAADFDRRRDEAQYQAALNRWREDDAAGCREALAQLLTRTPSHCAARLLLADVELSQGSPKAALEQARQVLALEPKNAEAHHVMGLALDALGETTAAISHYEQATRLDSQNEQYAACYHAALDASLTPNAIPSDAIRPENIASPHSADSIVYADGPNEADRSGHATAAGNVDPTSAHASVDSDSDESPDARRAVIGAAEALRNNRPQDAIDLANGALRRHPKSASLFRVLGAAQYRLGDFSAAQVAIAQALSLDKSDALAYFLMGSTLARLGQAEAAERQFAEAARLDPRFGPSRD
jgi:tetratricopeptide (TPR) repeat protein